MEMDAGILVSILMIKSTVKVVSLGLLVKNMMVVGRMVSSMAQLLLPVRMAKPNKENGKMENELSG